MTPRLILAVLAVAIGVALAVVALVAFAVRERGSARRARMLVFAGMLVYFVALWIYALAPLPSPQAIECAPVEFEPLPLTRGAGALGPGDPLADPAVLAFVLTVALFLPLGFFVRVLWNRGVVAALAAGLGLAMIVELTQLTGVWGLYPCAYRSLAVADLIAAGLGAVVGSVASLALPWSWRVTRSAPAIAEAPRPVTRLRRALAMTCDWVSVYLTGFVISSPVAAVLSASGGPEAVEAASVPLDAVATYSAIAVTAGVALGTGRTIGDRILQLEYRGGPLPPIAARLVRYLCGIGGYQILTAFTEGANPVSAVYVAVSIGLVFTTSKGRGLPGLASRRELVDARDAAAAATGSQAGSSTSR